MHIHILGICGTFMGGIAAIAKALGHQVTGSDQNVYPPMSEQLTELGIGLVQGYDSNQFSPEPDLVIIGNALSRGNEAVEYVLSRGLRYTSGPQWLAEQVLQDRWVLAVAGTHGKTTTSSMLAWILEAAGLKPGFLIGGIPQNFDTSARLGESPFFVIEADEYDTAFFDKRSKFVHYRPRTLVINNLEFDHADIFPDLAAIQRQFHHLLRMVPANGLVLSPEDTKAVSQTLAMGCWSERQSYGQDWRAELLSNDGSAFKLFYRQQLQGELHWQLGGQHNVDNAVMAIAAARHAGVPVAVAIEAMSHFVAPKRRMELKADIAGIKVYDDFAHHPTAIATTLQGVRNKVGQGRLLAVLEPRSNTMRMGVHEAALPVSLAIADHVYLYEPANANWSLEALTRSLSPKARLSHDIEALVGLLVEQAIKGDNIVIMSNGGFGGIHDKLIQALAQKWE
ncbi:MULTISPECIES: UDP-N-acetylmuramate:L-alanyl-gamma-D-glutamyl-meso-diaminopimelate ligase [unclassified Arsukibacterium]|uniref:UDP-N-acetylmuramate:L-alanyl-gamma-D-glutamyl- meso-diaminopimelate ligase n=1 Tax=unclassified Arsukibacterium TaxID=2635278 RepID=UPI000C55524A|nr:MULTISPECIES: UDP-N-acetylmuramate:L-alanyl-gamma-D-glutamyl-meso-diaminopimelate ligase [unclassified Arsukibacterium]MAA95758.1 UDP-N-acetylmuramate:L-alanyl-gamma-D-glutamyl-meso-diaminopimelate ligase [Rheinheimera sp.]MBM33606.1 UDP-N-acetylmuramate:L-alanyl-gamma-D-glutamyl-meso-diaminopimelate ligase [Rheinheimera sp.]HAW92809.1 UDP-N-acetylmuramate:L-alanyl-gamma-D-glutamyl-meso-diaminopimelate ligase [Candidatus Azambacteria bacterium]|tara:strand:+ start:181941 stop:183296 length:1356 start_codon:yes stop_codon:yes gene_type:complete